MQSQTQYPVNNRCSAKSSFSASNLFVAVLIALLLIAGDALAQDQRPRRGNRGENPGQPGGGGGGGNGGRFQRERDDVTLTFRSNPAVLQAFKSVVAEASQSAVIIQCDNKTVALGTIVSADGFILTKYSELSGDAVAKLKDGKSFKAAVVGVDSKFDIALLKIDAKNLKPIVWKDSSQAVVGNFIASVGTRDQPVAVGVVSVASRAVKMREQGQPSAPANSGFLGVGLDEAEGGARIMTVQENSAASKAGLRKDDIVHMIQDTPIIDSESMINTIQIYRPGDQVTIKFTRDDKEMTVQATLAKRPPVDPRLDRRDFQNALGSTLSNRRNGFPRILQHDSVLSPADCGGPLVDLDGKAVGINIARAGRVESYALPAEDLQQLITQLKSTKPTTQPTAAQPATKPTTRPIK